MNKLQGLKFTEPQFPCGKDVRIGLLEDDSVIAELLMIAFEQAGWDYHHYTSIAAISEALQTRSFDLLVLDWSLPDGQADSVIRLARERYGWQLPIVIESVYDDEQRIVHALELGADDYVVKPLRMSEVQARIAALLRRSRPRQENQLALGPFRIDESERLVRLDGESLQLTLMEYELAAYFFRHPNELLSRERLLSEVWERNPEVDTRTVDAHVSRLRKKLRFGPETGVQIITLRGYGYRLEYLS